MKILRISIIKGHGADHIYLWADLPSSEFPFEGNLCVHFRAAKGTGVKYCEMHWPDVKATVVEQSV